MEIVIQKVLKVSERLGLGPYIVYIMASVLHIICNPLQTYVHK